MTGDVAGMVLTIQWTEEQLYDAIITGNCARVTLLYKNSTFHYTFLTSTGGLKVYVVCNRCCGSMIFNNMTLSNVRSGVY